MPDQNSEAGDIRAASLAIVDVLKAIGEFIGVRHGGARSGRGGIRVKLQDYDDALGNFLKFPPGDLRQTYSDVLMQVYPLQADLKALERFCAEYFSLKDNPLIEIRPVAPWVIMAVCDYGKMALKTENIGWVSQHELAFGFPVALYDRDAQGNQQFRDWALVYPFIYVDNPVSMSLGRQVYGWPKAGIEIKSARANLAPDLRCLATVDLHSGPERSELGDAADTRFLEVFQRQPLWSGRAGAASLFTYVARLSADYMSSISASFDLVRNAGYDWRVPSQSLGGMVRQFGGMTTQYLTWYDYVDGFLKSASRMARARQAALQRPFEYQGDNDKTDAQLGEVKTITLKQFRDAEDPKASCYRAIVVSTMGYSQPTDGAFIVSDPLSPDISGGVLINLYGRDTDSSVVKSLGLQGCTKVVNEGSRTTHTLQPVMPFWAKLDLTCGSGDCQWSRTKYTGWSVDNKPRNGGPQNGGMADHIQGPKDSSTVPYTMVGSGAAQEIRGPLDSANFGLRVFGIPAVKKTLQDLCAKYLQPSGQTDFTFDVKDPSKQMMPPDLAGRADGFVLMLVSSFDGLSGKGRDADSKNLHDRVLTFAVPATLKYQRKQKDVLIPLYTFVEQDWDFLTEYEVYGRLAFKADLQSPPNNWIDDTRNKSELLTAYTTIFPGEVPTPQKPTPPQSARVMPLVQIWKSRSDAVMQEKNPKASEIAANLVGGYQELMGLGSHALGSAGANIVSIGLKQVRDAISPKSSCYQEIVLVNRQFSSGWDLKAEEPNLTVSLHKYPGFDLAEKMGVKLEDSKLESLILDGEPHQRYVLKTIPGAMAFGDMSESSAVSLCWSLGNGWEAGPKAAEALSR